MWKDNFRTVSKGGEELCPSVEGGSRQQIDAALFLVITGQIQGRLTGFCFFSQSDHRSHGSAGGTIHLYLLLSQAYFARTPSLALHRVAGGLADPWGVGVTTPAVQSANAAAERSSSKWQARQSGSLSRIRADSAVSSTRTLSHHDGQAACAPQAVLQVSAQLPYFYLLTLNIIKKKFIKSQIRPNPKCEAWRTNPTMILSIYTVYFL